MKIGNYKPLLMIKILRKHKGYTQKELAIRSGVALLTIQNLEHGVFDPYQTKYSTLLKIANTLKVSVDDLFKDIA